MLSWLDARTGRVTMYRLVLSCLGCLAAVGLLLSVVGLLPFAPLALVTTLVVALSVSYLANKVFAGLFGVMPHSESTLITGYLLFFIFPPVLTVQGLAGIAMAAVLAAASKYLLAFRGRHIFNPAAAGAFLLTLTGVYYSGWWSGNPVMLPFTLIASFLVLRRTGRMEMAGVFVAVSGGIMVLRSLTDGQTLISALTWPVTSSPMIFFVGMMLSEPLTQPPIRWQRMVFAGVVGVLFSVPMHLGSVYIAPESALMVGNAMAFLVGQRRGIELTLRKQRALSPTTIEFVFRPSRRIRFRPGQYVEITLPHKGSDGRGLRRVFSIASPPQDASVVRISTKIPEQASSFKQALTELGAGQVITATGVAGDFLLPKDVGIPLLLVAGGIGITPFASQLAALPVGHGRDIVILYSASGADEICYRAILKESAAAVTIVSAEELGELPTSWKSVHGSRITAEILKTAVPDIGERQVLISGPPQMVAGINAAARDLGARSVRTDFFSGY